MYYFKHNLIAYHLPIHFILFSTLIMVGCTPSKINNNPLLPSINDIKTDTYPKKIQQQKKTLQQHTIINQQLNTQAHLNQQAIALQRQILIHKKQTIQRRIIARQQHYQLGKQKQSDSLSLLIKERDQLRKQLQVIIEQQL